MVSSGGGQQQQQQQQQPERTKDAEAASAAAIPGEAESAAATAEAVRQAKAEVAAVVAARDVDAAFDAFARKQLADAGWTPEQAAAAAAASPATQALVRGGRRPRGGGGRPVGFDSAVGPPLPAPPSIPPALGVLATALVADTNSTVRQARVRAFQASLRRISALNAASGADLAYGLTPFSHLTPAEFRRLYLSAPLAELPKGAAEAAADAGGGGGSSSNDGNNSNGGNRRLLQNGNLVCNARVAFPYGGATPPPAKDWRNVNGVSFVPTAVRNQQSCGSCASFTAAALLESMVIRKYRANGYTAAATDVSEQEQLDCLAGDGCQGALPYQYLDRAVCRGVAFEGSSPYRNYDQMTCPSTAAVPRYASGARAWAEPPATERGMAQAADKGLVAIALLATDDFMNYRAGVFDCGAARGGRSINHATVIVGWNDAARMSTGATWRVWSVRNSWGNGWGEGGYFRLRKDCGGAGTLNMYTPGYNTVLVE
jgi:hypothetical protein